MPRRVVLCADDYAMSAGISRAILDLAIAGRISATSCITAMPGWPEAARELAAARLPIGVGLHLTLTWGRPLSAMPGLAPGGELPPLGALLRASLLGRMPAEEIAAEIAAQLDSFEQTFGRAPDFVDGHQHVHVLPGVRHPLLRVLRERGLAGRVWLRDPSDRISAIRARRLAAGKALIVAGFATGFGAAARTAGFRVNEGFSGFSPFDPARDPDRDFATYLRTLGPRPVVMCHPSRPDDAPADGIGPARAREYAYLGSPRFAELLASQRIELVSAPT